MCPSLLYLFFFFFFLSPPPFSYSYFYFSFSFRYAHRRPPFYVRIRTALFGQLRVESVAGIDRGSNFRHKIRLFARIRSRRFDSSRQRFSPTIRTWKFYQFLLAIWTITFENRSREFAARIPIREKTRPSSRLRLQDRLRRFFGRARSCTSWLRYRFERRTSVSQQSLGKKAAGWLETLQAPIVTKEIVLSFLDNPLSLSRGQRLDKPRGIDIFFPLSFPFLFLFLRNGSRVRTKRAR